MSYWLWQACLNADFSPDLGLLAAMGHSWLPTTTATTNVTIAD